jgi:hypothetical protein
VEIYTWRKVEKSRSCPKQFDMTENAAGNLPRKKSSISHSFLGIVFEMAIALGAAIWFVYAYLPQYYLPVSFLLLAVGGIVAYVILSKSIDF